MAFKEGVEEIIGRRIKGVVMKRQTKGRRPPAMQLFLLFDNDTYYEFYTETDGFINTTSGVFAGSLGSVLSYMSDGTEAFYVNHPDAKDEHSAK